MNVHLMELQTTPIVLLRLGKMEPSIEVQLQTKFGVCVQKIAKVSFDFKFFNFVYEELCKVKNLNQKT